MIDSALSQKRLSVPIVAPVVPGGAVAEIDLMAGRIHSVPKQLATSLAGLKSGKYRAIAILTKDRTPVLPELKTVAESGAPAALLATGLAALWWSVTRSGRTLTYEFVPRRVHWVQMIMHSSVYAYWGWYWREVYHEIPLIAAQILPWFGGSAAVWTTCMLIFQALLFFGYGYAHLLARLPLRWQAVRIPSRLVR